MTKVPKFKKSDFTVGQKVYSESVNNSFSNNRVDGKIEEEEVVSVGNKYVTTNVNKYSLENGEEVSNHGIHHILHLDKEEAERKVAKDKLYKRLVKEFEQKLGGLENQVLYKTLTLEDLQEIAGIIDRRLWLEEMTTKINNAKNKRKQLETNLMKLWKEKNKFLALDKKIKISNGAKICVGFEKCGFEVVKGEKISCKFNINAKEGYDSGFTYFVEMNDEEAEQGILNYEETSPNFKTFITEILKKEGWAEKIESYTSVILKSLEERKK